MIAFDDLMGDASDGASQVRPGQDDSVGSLAWSIHDVALAPCPAKNGKKTPLTRIVVRGGVLP